MSASVPGNTRAAPSDAPFALMTALFFLSGAAGLAYQVLWMRQLGLFLGSDLYGVSIILGSFMGGLALGSWLGGRLAEATVRPLLWYGLAEIGIGLLALRFAPLLGLLEPLLLATYAPEAAAPPWHHHATRVLLALGALLTPTVLMGTTLPLVLRHFVRSRDALGRLAAHFYAVNTLGALAGTLASGFLLLPYLGMRASTLCAVALNLAVGITGVILGSRAPIERVPGRDAVAGEALVGPDPRARPVFARAAILALGLSGFASFALEVVWTRVLMMSFSATVYSFAAMLACFLLGIFLGSRLISDFVDTHPSPLRLFAALELGTGASVALLCLLVNAVPGLFGRLLTAVALLLGDAREHALVVSTLVASLVLLAGPTTLLGATFPVALRIHTPHVARVGSRAGNLYAANTLGAILGSIVGGLVLLPAIGARASLAGVALTFAAVGVWLSRVEAGRWRPAAAGAFLATATAAGAALLLPYRATLNFNQRADVASELLFHADGVQATIDVIRSPSGVTALAIGGNVEADDSKMQRRHFVLKGHLPLLLVEAPRSVLVVGLGMGITLRATARHPGVERIDVVELSPEIVDAQAVLREINGDVTRDPRVHVRIDDGRAFLKLSQGRYDMITADPIHPKISRVGYLYTREYYEAVRNRLAPGGVVCQWMPVYQISPRRLRSAVGTFLEVFPHATLWYVDNHALLLARSGAPEVDFALFQRRFAHPAVREDLASIGIASPEALLPHLLLGPAELRAFVRQDGDIPLNTDDHPYLEYFVPGDLFYRVEDNERALAAHLAAPTTYVRNAPEAARAEILAHSKDREARLLHQGDGGPGSG